MSNPLDLSQLTEDDIDFETELPKVTARLDTIEKECKEKYGDDWWEYYVRATIPDIDKDFYEEIAYDAIYRGTEPTLICSPEIIYNAHKHYQKKMKEIFGKSWRFHIHHKKNDPKVNKMLIKDALKIGKWRELPKELQEEYHKQAERTKKECLTIGQ